MDRKSQEKRYNIDLSFDFYDAMCILLIRGIGDKESLIY